MFTGVPERGAHFMPKIAKLILGAVSEASSDPMPPNGTSINMICHCQILLAEAGSCRLVHILHKSRIKN